jgi:PAS domain S-box-containing protein
MIRDDRGGGGKVLLLGAEPDLERLLIGVLLEEGFSIRVARDPAEAVGILRSEPIALTVVEAGEEPEHTVERLREATEAAHPPVLVLTDHLSHELIALLSGAGAADLILKPVQAEEFAARVRAVLRAGRSPRSEPAAGGTAPDLVDIAAGALDLLSSLPAWLLVVDKELRLRFANRSFLELRGETLAELAGEGLGEVLPPGFHDLDGVLAEVRRVVREEVRASLPARRVGGTGRTVDLEVRPLRLRDEPYAILILHDVTDHWRAREQIRREKRKLEEIVDGMGASLGVLDPELRVIWSNRKFREWFGEMWGRRFDHALRGLLLVGDTDPEKIFTEPEYISKEWAHYTAGGDKRYYRNIILPSHDEAGRLRELVLVTQDLTEVTLRSEQHRLLRDLGNLLQSTLELDRLLYIILTCATAGHALGFNRAFVFLPDEDGRTLRGRMGVGPSSREEAFTIWAELAGSRKTLSDLTSDFEQLRIVETHPLTRVARGITYPLTGPEARREIVPRTALENEAQVVRNVTEDDRVTNTFRATFGSREFVSVPLQSKGKVVGVLLADNVFSNRPISPEQISILELFAAPAGLAVDNARTYEALRKSLLAEREAQDELLQSERLATVGRLAAHVAHEIRNPLTTIGGFARALLKRPEDVGRVESSAVIIAEEVSRLERILSEVMDFTRPVRLHRVPGHVNEVVRKVADLMAPELSRGGIELALELDENLPGSQIDTTQLYQALLNLVRNATEILESPESRGRERRIAVRTLAGEEGAVQIEVRDTGPGVPEDLLPSMFDPFVSRRIGGTGLGLAVVRKILLDHGGDASVANGEGGGAVFTLTLPPVGPGD